MPAAPIPSDEALRLASLKRMRLLDTPPEQFFEDIVDLLVDVLSAPMAAVTLVDADRQWFKARRGLDISEGPRNDSFCAYTILHNVPLIVADARKDSRVFDMDCVAAGVTAYAAAPIGLADGFRIGAVCAVDTKPRRWSLADIKHIERCARFASEHIQARCGELR